MKIALQLYSLRDDARVDYAATVKAAGQVAGYTGCEFAGYNGLSADEMKALLAEAGLEPIGTHLGIDALRNNLAGEVAYAAAVGIKTAVCPYVSADSAEGWAALGREMEGFAKAFAKVGIPFGYHNHAHEFQKFDGKYALDILFENAPSVFPELDLHWVAKGGEDPVSYVKKYGDRIKALHAKDITPEGEEIEVGNGIIDFAACAAAAPNCDYMIVEHEVYACAPIESVAIGRKNLEKVL